MNDDTSPEESEIEPPSEEADWKRRRRLEAVFGDVLPETTSDEREDGSPEPEGDAQERWLRSQVPPHHG